MLFVVYVIVTEYSNLAYTSVLMPSQVSEWYSDTGLDHQFYYDCCVFTQRFNSNEFGEMYMKPARRPQVREHLFGITLMSPVVTR